MHEFTEPNKAVGIILDISIRHDSNGNRLIDEVKKSLIDLVMGYMEDDIDLMYLYHPDVVDVADKHGLQCCHINSYDSDGYLFNLTFALKQTLYTLAMQDISWSTRKYIFLITDRLNESYSLATISKLNQKDLVDAKIVVVGIGNMYDKTMIPDDVIHIHLNHPSELCDKLTKGEVYGE